MIRFLREMVREMARLSLPAKIAVGLIIPVIFVVVTQWERLTFKHPPLPEPPKVSIAPQQPAPPPADKAQAMAADAALAKRLTRFVIVDPNVQGNGSITGIGHKLYLYGIKQLIRKRCVPGRQENDGHVACMPMPRFAIGREKNNCLRS
jgi:hypothetical protein